MGIANKLELALFLDPRFEVTNRTGITSSPEARARVRRQVPLHVSRTTMRRAVAVLDDEYLVVTLFSSMIVDRISEPEQRSHLTKSVLFLVRS